MEKPGHCSQLWKGRGRREASKEDAAFVALLRNHRKTLLFVFLAPRGRIRKQTVTINKETMKTNKQTNQYPQAANLFLKIMLAT